MNNENNNVGNGLNDVINNNQVPNNNPLGTENSVMMGASPLPESQVVMPGQEVVTGAEQVVPQSTLVNQVNPTNPVNPVNPEGVANTYNATPNNIGIGNVGTTPVNNNLNNPNMMNNNAGAPFPNQNEGMSQVTVSNNVGVDQMPNANQGPAVGTTPTPVQGLNPGIGLGATPMPAYENPGSIGVTPPPINPKEEKKKNKKGMNKTLFIVLVIVLIMAVGAGVYWYLNLNNGVSGINVTLKDVAYDLNDEVSTEIKDYANISGTNSSNCVLDTDKIDTSKVGEYEYTVTCGQTPYKGKAIVADNSVPIASPLSVTKTVGSTIEAEEFIATCYDNGKCTYAFEDEEAVKALMTTAGGPTKVTIIVKDENNNEVKVESNLTVIAESVRAMYECTSKEQNVEDYNASMTMTHSLGILGTSVTDTKFGDFGKIIYNFKFSDESQFSELLTKFKSDSEITLAGVTGAANFNEKDLIITMIQDLNVENLKTQYGADKYQTFASIQSHYQTTLGYTCKVATY